MRHNRYSRSCLPRRNQTCLGTICGSNIDTGDVNFTGEKSNLVYMDKVFSYNDETSCPFLFCMNTSGPNANRFKVELTYGDNCGFNSCTLDKNAVFNVENSFVAVEYFGPVNPESICRNQVTVDGCPVDDLLYSNGQYMCGTADLMADISKDRCMDCGLATKAFFLVNEAGPWEFKAKFVLEGTVNTCGRTTNFRCEISSKSNTPNIPLPDCSHASFSVPRLALPCPINGIAPDIKFQFGANIELVNPQLCVAPKGEFIRDCSCVDDDDDCDCGCGNDCNCGCDCGCDCGCGGRRRGRRGCGCDDDYSIVLTGNVAIEPTMHVEVVRQTLFCVNACEGLVPCDGSLVWAEAEDEDCTDPFGPDCSCGSNNNSILTTVDSGCGCSNNVIADEDCGCSNNNSSCGNSSCGCGRPGCNGSCGWNSPASCGCGRPGCNGSCGYDRPVPGPAPIRPRRYSGYNGCSW